MKLLNKMVFIAMVSLLVLSTKVKAEAPDISEQPIKEYAFERVLSTWGYEQWASLNKLVIAESNWKPTAQNSKSSAYGTFQFLNSTWELVGCEKTNDPYEQIDCGIEYIEDRYDTPKNAWNFHLKNNYY